MPNSASELSALGELGDCCAAMHLPATADELPPTEGWSLPRGGVLVDLGERTFRAGEPTAWRAALSLTPR